MALASGTRLGPYEIESPLGAGGMGEVYRARDTRLERTVAIKVLNAQLVASAELRARIEREAKVISRLQHPNICVLHDVGSEGPIDFLVMEFLQGESLAERLLKGPLPVEQALTIAIEIADALEKAHRAGVVHRDLKPGNVMLTKSGAKLLDFGLAKPLAAAPTAGGRGSGSASVLAAALTQTMPSPSPTTPLSTAGGNRHGAIYVARAGAGVRGRRALRHFFLRHDAVRNGDRQACLRRKNAGQHCRSNSGREPALGQYPALPDTAGSGPRHSTVPR